MERTELDQLERVVNHEIKARFPRGAVERVVMLQHGDEPVIRPGELLVRVLIPAPGGPERYAQSLAGWAGNSPGTDGVAPAGTVPAASASQAARVHLRRHQCRHS